MREIDMLSEQEASSVEITPTFSRNEDWIVAHRGGILHSNIELGQTIKKNECIGMTTDPFGTEVIKPIKSPQEGIVVGINTSPLVHEGLPVFKIASFLDYEKTESAIEEWGKQQPDSYMNS